MNKIIVKKALNDNDFVGIYGKENSLTISFPIGYHIEESEFTVDDKEKIEIVKKDFHNLIKLLSIKENDNYSYGDNKFSFSSAMFIIDDYLKNGLLVENQIFNKLNGSSKINWKKTISELEPVYYNNNFFFLDLYTYQKNNLVNNITMIQEYCLSIAFKIIGWMYYINDYHYVRKPFDDDVMVTELTNKLFLENDDRKKKLLNELIYFIKGTNNDNFENNKEFKIGRDHFDKIWESLLRKQIYNLYNEYNCLPTTYYYVDKTKELIDNSSLIPDIVVKKDNLIFIFDAKYYKDGCLPQSGDVVKQLFYGQYVMKKNAKCIVKNIFLLPKDLDKEKIEYFGYSNAFHLGENNNILVYYLDTKSVIESDKLINNLIEKILKNA